MATFDGKWVYLDRSGQPLYDQGGYGRPDKKGLRLSPEEALYLLLRGKIESPDFSFESLLSEFVREKNFMRKFLVYRDIRERGFVIQPGPHDFRIFKRGEKPKTGQSKYLLRVLSERDTIDFYKIAEETRGAFNMRKQFLLAVVDDEDELTYYEVSTHKFEHIPGCTSDKPVTGNVFGTNVIAVLEPDSILEQSFFGTRLSEDYLLLSPLEAVYLNSKGMLILIRDGKEISPEIYTNLVMEEDNEFVSKLRVYSDLRNAGMYPRTGYKFGHHFRVYSGQHSHSELLVHAYAANSLLSMSIISRSVRMSHSVKKKMLFASLKDREILYIEFKRIKL